MKNVFYLTGKTKQTFWPIQHAEPDFSHGTQSSTPDDPRAVRQPL